MRFRYNIIIFIGRLTFITFFIFVYYKLFTLISADNGIMQSIFPLIFIFALFSYFSFSFFYSIIKETYDIEIDENFLCLTRPLIGKGKRIEIKKIKGYSNSKIKFGVYAGIRLFDNKSIILYPFDSKPIELIGFNYSKFNKLEDKLKDIGIEKLGYEDYKTGMYFRKYKFEK
jgi:hypothetical protein